MLARNQEIEDYLKFQIRNANLWENSIRKKEKKTQVITFHDREKDCIIIE